MNDDPAPEHDAADALVVLEAAPDAEAREDLASVARIGTYVVPVAIVHLALIYFLVQAITGWSFARIPHSDRIVGWLWINGAALAAGAWVWRKNRMPLRPSIWLQGRRARLAILTWLALSILWFLAPALLNDAWEAARDRLSTW